MTKSEAIECLKEIRTWAKGDSFYECIDMAIEALKREPCEDTISRQAVDKIIKKYRDEQAARLSERCLERAYGANAVGMLISDLPSVTPQSKTGHWIEVTNGRGGHECDLCHNYAPSYQSGNEYLSPFCPKCGVMMVEPQESEDKE